MRHWIVAAAVLTLYVSGPIQRTQAAGNAPLAESFLTAGKLAEGEVALSKHLDAEPRDQQTRFGLGANQFIRSIERLEQSLYRYGMRFQSQWLPFLRVPVPPNPEPEQVSYAKMRQIYSDLQADLTRAEHTLSKIDDRSVKLPLHFGQIRLDLNADGRADDTEVLWRLYQALNRAARTSPEVAAEFVIGFDYADVLWLRGYCHLLLTLTDVILAHDWEHTFQRTAHVFFPKVDTPYREFLVSDDEQRGITEIADLIAMIHLISWDVKEPERMKSALAHLKQVITLSRQNWDAIQAEADDDHEWIPNVSQTGIIPGIRITADMIGGWKDFLDEMQDILDGRKLLPHWRFRDRGINLRKVFEEPRRFDLVLWAQGSATLPYLEDGQLTNRELWWRLQRVFQGEFFGFALWFN